MDAQLEIDVELDGPKALLRLRGEVDLASVPTLRACVEAIDPGIERLVLDLTEVTFLDSTGLGEMARAHARLEASGAGLEVRGARGMVARALEISGLAERLTGAP